MIRRLTLRLLLRVLPPLLSSSGLYAAGAPELMDASRERIDDILTKLQQRSDGLTDIRCKVRFVEDDRINLSKRTKYGTILFLITDPNPHFLIHFDKTEADGVLGKQEWYLFDGRWLYEVLERIRQVTKREIARPGEKVDLFDLENAPFPLPFGQNKEAILRNFDVTLAPLADGDPPNTDHLVCVPKAESRLHRRYEKLEFFVLRDVHLPSRVVVTKGDGLEISTADFPDLSAKSINAGVTKKDFARPKTWKKYEVVVEKLPPESKPEP
ncbi:MAG: hypothetical protein WBE26_19335 [Phycisphaerae bacterium]